MRNVLSHSTQMSAEHQQFTIKVFANKSERCVNHNTIIQLVYQGSLTPHLQPNSLYCNPTGSMGSYAILSQLMFLVKIQMYTFEAIWSAQYIAFSNKGLIKCIFSLSFE